MNTQQRLKHALEILLGLTLVAVMIIGLITIADKIGLFDKDESIRCGLTRHIEQSCTTNAWGTVCDKACIEDRK